MIRMFAGQTGEDGRSRSARACAFVALLCLFLGTAGAFGLEVPRLSGRVNDLAGMISPPARAALEAELADLERTDSTQVVVLTVTSLDGDVLEEFSIRVADAWKIGRKGKDNGVLLIVSKQDRKMRIEVGRGLQGVLTDLQAGRIIDGVIKPRFKQGRFDDGFLEGTRAIIAATRGEYQTEPQRQGARGNFFEPLLFLAVVILPFLRRINRFLPVPAGALGGPLLYYLIGGGGASAGTLLLLAAGGALVGLVIAGLGGGSPTHDRHGTGTGGFWGPSSGSTGSGGSGGIDFGGGGGSFDGGGSSGDW